MPERASVYELTRFGVEAQASPGVPVPANMILQSVDVSARPILPRNPIRAVGRNRPVGVTGAKGHTEWSFDAAGTYNDVAVLLSAILCRPTVTTPVAGVAELTFKPSGETAAAINTLTVERGQTGGGSARFPGAFLTDFSISFSRNEVQLSGSGLGRRYDEGVTLTASPSNVAIAAMEPDRVDIRVADTVGGLTANGAQLSRVTSAQWSVTGRQSPIFTLDTRQGSFSASVERAHDMAAQIVLQQDSEGVAMMDRLRSKAIMWARYRATGGDIVTGQPYSFEVTFPAFVSQSQLADSDDIYAGTYDLVPIYDASWAGWTEIKMRVPTAVSTLIATQGTPVSGYVQDVATSLLPSGQVATP